MNKSRAIACFFSLFAIGAILETANILTSRDKEMVSLMAPAFVITGGFISTAIFFWIKGNKDKQ